MTSPPVPIWSRSAGPSVAAQQLADQITGKGEPVGSRTRRVATVSNVNSDNTLDVTWPTGQTVSAVPSLANPLPASGDVVVLLGYGNNLMDYVVIGTVINPDATAEPQAGRGIISRVSTTSDGAGFSGTSEFEVTQLRTPAAQFYTGRLYRSTFLFGETANGGNDSAFCTVKRSGAVFKGEITQTTVIADGFGFATTFAGCVDYNMPTGSFNMEIFLDPTGRGMKFYALSNAFHTVEDIGRDAW